MHNCWASWLVGDFTWWGLSAFTTTVKFPSENTPHLQCLWKQYWMNRNVTSRVAPSAWATEPFRGIYSHHNQWEQNPGNGPKKQSSFPCKPLSLPLGLGMTVQTDSFIEIISNWWLKWHTFDFGRPQYEADNSQDFKSSLLGPHFP